MKYFFASLALVLLTAGSTQAALLRFNVSLDGIQEVDSGGTPVGDPDGTGEGFLIIDTGSNTVSWSFTTNNIDLPLIAAHIHQAPAGSVGAPIVDFLAQLSGSGVTDPDLALVVANPAGFYVNLHNALFPGGAIRDQLGEPILIREPAVAWLLAMGLVGWAVRRRAEQGLR